jgi:protein TonB
MRTKSKLANLEGRRILFFEAGVTIALCLALAAFEWPTTGDININIIKPRGIEPPIELIPITHPEKIVPPPPPLPTIKVINIREDDFVMPETDNDIFKEINQEDFNLLLKKFTVEEPEVEEVIPFFQIEQKPTFMGGDFNTFNKWVARNIIYPEIAVRNNIEGRVILRFIIDTDGTVKDLVVISGADRVLEEEALRVVSSSPAWSPGKQRGKPTRVIFTFPVIFKLQN